MQPLALDQTYPRVEESDTSAREYKELKDELDENNKTTATTIDGIFFDGRTANSYNAKIWYAWNSFWYPPQVPPSCQLFRLENICIPMSYLMMGLLQGLSGPLLNVLPLDLGASEAQQVTIAILGSLPASFKLLFGFVSDTFPIFGYRRKSYMLMGWLFASLSIWQLLWWSNLQTIQPDKDGSGCFGSSDNDRNGANENNNAGAPSIPLLAGCFLGFGSGVWLADVMADALVAEKARLELPEARGSLQSTCYSYRFFGTMCAVPLSTWMYSAHGPYPVVVLLMLLPLLTLPFIYLLREVKDLPVASTREQALEIWNTVSSRATWQPMGFVFLYNVLQVGNAAWKEFMRTVLGFTSCQLNLLFLVALVLLYVGILVYKYCLIQSSWRYVYLATTVLGAILSALQVCLIHGFTFGLSPFLFALGDDAFSELIMGIQFLPTTIMMVNLCPAGSEGASYALFTTINNAAINVSAVLSTLLLGIWDVSKETLERGELQGMVNLTYLTTAIQLSAIAFVGWLPHTKDDLIELKTKGGTSTCGGVFFLSVTFLSIAYAMIIGILNIANPGWFGES